MEQKRVSHKIAKAIKEAGYPLTKVECGRYDGHTPVLYAEPINAENWADCDSWYIPTYLDVWLWLWRKKNIRINTRDYFGGLAVSESSSSYDSISHTDPEDAIVATIEYLVDNDLIK